MRPGPFVNPETSDSVPPVTLLDGRIVDARDPPPHESCLIELPQLDSVRPVPLPGGVMPLVFETHCHPVSAESPQCLTELVVQLRRPFPPQECPNLVPPLQEFRSISPLRIFRVREHHTLRVACVP